MDRGGEDGGRQESEGRLADVNTTLFPFIFFFLSLVLSLSLFF
jgi:hypothetical protein